MYPCPVENPDPNLPPKGFSSKCYITQAPPSQVIPNNVAGGTLVKMDNKEYDVLNEFANVILVYGFTPTLSGYYLIFAQIGWTGVGGAGPSELWLTINGFTRNISRTVLTLNRAETQCLLAILYVTSRDLVQLRVWQNTGGNRTIQSGVAFNVYTSLFIHKIA